MFRSLLQSRVTGTSDYADLHVTFATMAANLKGAEEKCRHLMTVVADREAEMQQILCGDAEGLERLRSSHMQVCVVMFDIQVSGKEIAICL